MSCDFPNGSKVQFNPLFQPDDLIRQGTVIAHTWNEWWGEYLILFMDDGHFNRSYPEYLLPVEN